MKTNKINVVLSLNKKAGYSNLVNRYAKEEAGINGSNTIIRANGQHTETCSFYLASDYNGQIYTDVDLDSDTSYGSGFGSNARKIT